MRMLSASWRCVRTISLALCMVAAIPGAALAVGPGLEMEVGGPGNGQGKLGYITDLTFDSKNSLYVLDGARWDAKTKTVQGNLLVQKFDNGGKFLSQFSIGQGRNEKNLPSRIAVDSSGDVYITVSSADHVERYDAQGTLKATYPADGATGITTWLRDGKEYVAVLGGVRRNVPGKTIQVGGDQIVVIDPAAGLAQPVKLEEPLANVGDLASGPDGNLYALAGLTIRKIDPQGKIIERIGSSPNFDLKSTRAGDGSEPLHTVAVDSKGQIYSWSTGNPGELLRYSSDLKKVTLRGGQYKFADYWSPNAVYTPVAIDKNDKVWLGIPDSGGTAGPGKHTRGWVLRVRPDFIDRGETFDARMMGLRPRIDVPVPYSIVYEPKQPVPFELTLPAANRLINALTIRYAAYDMYKNAIGNGQIDVKLTNGEAVKIPFTITPPAFGWYTVECQLINGSDVLTTLGEHIGVTPKYEGMVALAEGESKGGWEDVPRQMFVGLSNVRLHPGPQADASLEAAQKYGATAFMQITSSPKDLTPEFVRPLFEKFKGRVKYWEVINEPNFSISPEKLAEVYAWLYPMLKEIDPEAKVMGPAVCGVILPYHEAFFKAGGAKYLDVLSVHDYEGHESVDLYHWQWKFAALRKMMADYGIGDREIWQTERVLTGVRGNVSLFGTQAIRTTFHRDMLETLGIPPQHNNHYYLNDGGYKSVPSYIWSANGPHPAALALRTRYGLTLGQKYQGTLDFGPGGNDVFMGLRYANDQYSTLVLRNMGTQDQDLTLDVRGGSQSVTIYDAFGNASTQPVNNGKLTLKIGQMPTYVRLGAKQQAAVVVEDYGRNIASAATITYSGPYQGDFGWLVNNVMETVHSGYHWGGTGGPFIWRAPLTTPQTMEIRFEQPRTIDRLQMFGTRADNNWCALREYDVEYFDGTKWVTIEQVRIQIPETSAAKTAGAAANTWHQDNNLYVHHFAPVKTDRLRVRFIRTTLGFFPDGATRPADSHMPQYVFLREIRVFSPRQPVELAAVASPEPRALRSDREPVELRVTNKTDKPFTGKVALTSKSGWKMEPAEVTVSVAAGQEKTEAVQLIPPAQVVAGYTPLGLALTDSAGNAVDITNAAIAYATPLRLETASPEVADGKTTLSVTVVNTTGNPLSGTVRVKLQGPRSIEPIVASFGPIEAQKKQAVDIEAPGLDFQRESWSAHYEATVDHITVTSAAQDLAARPWLVFGPFASGFPDPLAGSATVDVTRSVTDQMGSETKWRPAMSDAEGMVDLGALTSGQTTDVWAYALVRVQSPTARQAILAVGADDNAEVSLNGQPVLTSKSAKRFASQKPVQLKAGWNEVLIKSANAKDRWGFYCDLLGQDGQPLKDLSWSIEQR